MNLSATPVTLRVPAKINLYLAVLARRPDGYHEIETLMHSISLFDELTLAPAEEITVTCGTPGIPEGGENLVWKAAVELRRTCGLPEGYGAAIQIVKRIPMGAGLGGGSADAAATLVGLSRLWGLESDPDLLHAAAARLGSDVPFFLQGGAAVARGRGERLEKVHSARPLWLVLVKPSFPVSTAWAYSAWDPASARQSTLPFVLAALERGDPSGAAVSLRNDLQPAVSAAHPEIALLCERLRELGALGACMTGSGSAVFAITPGEAEAGALAARLDRDCGEVFVAHTLPFAPLS